MKEEYPWSCERSLEHFCGCRRVVGIKDADVDVVGILAELFGLLPQQNWSVGLRHKYDSQNPNDSDEDGADRLDPSPAYGDGHESAQNGTKNRTLRTHPYVSLLQS